MAAPRHCGKDKFGIDVWKVEVCGGANGKGGYVRKAERVHGSRRDAERRYAALLIDIGKAAPSSRMTVAEWVDSFLASHLRTLSPRTQECYRALARLRVVPALGRTRLADVTPRQIMHLMDALAHGKRRDGKPGTVGAATLGKYHRFLNLLFSRAVYRGLLRVNPVAAVKPPKGERTEARSVSLADARRILDALDGEPLAVQVVFRLALSTGLRRGELIALRWSDVDMDTGRVRVERAAVRIAGGQLAKPTKSARGLRVIALPADVVQLLQNWKQLAGTHQDGYILTWPDGRWFDIDYPTRAWSQFLRRASARLQVQNQAPLPTVNLHGLRHTYVSALLSAGMPPHEVAAVSGHAPETMLRVYAHVLRDASERAKEAISQVFTTETAPPVVKDGESEAGTQEHTPPS